MIAPSKFLLFTAPPASYSTCEEFTTKMEFWGVEVKAGESLKVQPEFGKLIHISQASLGEVKDVKGAKYVPLRLKIDEKKFVIGSLSAEDRTQLMFDLVFEREFEISHDWKNGSVYFIGYTADEPASGDDEFPSDEFEDDSEDEPLPVDVKENGVIKAKSADVKAVEGGRAGGKAKAEVVTKKEKEPKPDNDDEDDDESDSDDEMALDGLQGDDSDDISGDDDSEDEDDSSDEEELPKAQKSKKRSAELVKKAPASKKAKSATPDKTGKKGQAATPAPSKSGGQLSCKPCSKTFTTENALRSHNKAKHGGK